MPKCGTPQGNCKKKNKKQTKKMRKKISRQLETSFGIMEGITNFTVT